MQCQMQAHAQDHPIASDDGRTVELFSLLQIDWNRDDIGIRRARLGARGDINDRFSFKSEFNFDENGSIEARDLIVTNTITQANLRVRIGHQRTPNSLDSLTSSRHHPLRERAAFTGVFDLNRRIGASASFTSDLWSLEAGVYGDNINDRNPFSDGAFAARAVHFPAIGDMARLHLGASYRFSKPSTSSQFVGLEAGIFSRRIWVMSEYARQMTDDPIDLDFATTAEGDGGYFEVGAVINGTRPYRLGSTSDLVKLSPLNRDLGVVSVVARYDWLSSSDCLPTDCEHEAAIVGFTWKLNQHAKIGLDTFWSRRQILGHVPTGLDPDLFQSQLPFSDGHGLLLRVQISAAHPISF